MVKDALGATIEIGDRGVYATGGRYVTRGVIEVLGIKKLVRARWLNCSPPIPFDPNLDNTISIHPHLLYLVDKFKESP